MSIDLARRIEEIADRLEEQAHRHTRQCGPTQHEGGPCYFAGLADAKAALAIRLRDALTAPDPKPADHHTGTEDAAGHHMRQHPTGTEWLVAHKDEPDEGEVA